MAFSNQVFACGTISQLIVNPQGPESILCRVTGGGTVILGGSTSPGVQPTGLAILAADNIVNVPVRSYGGAANQDDGLYARTTAGGTAVLNVFQSF